MKGRTTVLGMALVMSLLTGRVCAQEQFVLQGTVVDSVTHEPVHGAYVTVRGRNMGVATDSLGHYSLSMPRGAYLIALSHIAYKKVLRTIRPDLKSPVVWNVALVPSPIQLGEVAVTAMQPFAVQRAEFSLGTADFEKLGEQQMGDALVYLLPTVFSSAEARYRAISKDFTLYVNGEWKESLFLNDIDPFSVRQVLIWDEKWSPVGYPLRRGEFVVSIRTK